MIFGDFELGLTASILVGSIPGIFLGARLSSRAPDYVVRPSLVVVLLLSSLKLVGAPSVLLAVGAPAAVLGGVGYAVWAARQARAVRRRQAPASEPAVEAGPVVPSEPSLGVTP